MNIAVFGLGYVGTVTAACFSHLGHKTIGVDTDPVKVDLCLLYTSPSPRDQRGSRMPSSA